MGGELYTYKGQGINGRWTDKEKLQSINTLELLPIKFAIKSFLKEHKDGHIRIMSDNVTTVAYINNMGGYRSSCCNKIALDIREWASIRNLWLSAAHIPGVHNVIVDFESKKFRNASEWISDKIFKKLWILWGKPDFDLFVTRLNSKLPKYVSWKPDPGFVSIDAFSIS